MKKNILFIIVIESLIILCFVFFSFNEYKIHKRSKEIFINKFYFLLTDISNSWDTIVINNDETSFTLYVNLTKLDTICKMHNEETNGTFHYNSPGIFGVIMNNIHQNKYDQDELKMIESDIIKMKQDISDNNGIAENSDLSYNKLNDIIDTFYNRWIN